MPSHRFIPPGPDRARPSLQDFVTPELFELRRAYEQALRERRNRPDPAQASPPIFTHRNATILQPEARELIERLDPPFPQSTAQDLADEIAAVNDQLAGELGESLGKSLRNDVEFEPPTIEIPLNFDDLREAYLDSRNQVRQLYRDALDQYNSAWPRNQVPGSDWIKKVHPLINPEVARQFAEVTQRGRASADADDLTGSLSTSGSATSASSSPSLSTQNQVSRKTVTGGLLDSVIGTIDKRGADWLKSASRRVRGKRSLWNRVAAQSKSHLRKWNRRITTHSSDVARRRQAASPTLDTRALSTDARTFDWRRVVPVLAAFLIVGVAAGCGYWLVAARTPAEGQSKPNPYEYDRVSDRETLLRACHVLAVRRCGWSSRFWNHRKVFAQLKRGAGKQACGVQQLAEIYERARYAPDGWLSAEDVECAKRLLAQMQQISAVAA